MRFGFALQSVRNLISLLLLSFSVVSAGLHFTDSEISAATTCQQITALGWTDCEKTEWNVRRVSGPYKNTGDVSANSPGDWTRIESQAATFLANPSQHRWSGATSCPTEGGPNPPRVFGTYMHNAAFYYFLTGNTSYRTAVQNELQAQAGTTGTNFANTTLWCINGNGQLDIPNWIFKLLLSYDFIRNDISAGNRATLDAWFTAAAVWLEGNVHEIVNKRWPNRKLGDYSSSPMAAGSSQGNVYRTAMEARNWHAAWFNKPTTQTRTFGSIGVIVSNATHKTEAKRFFKEWMRYAVCYTNCGDTVTQLEYYRCCGNNSSFFPGLGYHYAASALTSMTFLADILARNGDTELYEYSTSEGTHGTEGGPKTLPAAITTHLKMGRKAIARCGVKASVSLGSCNIHTNIGYFYPGDPTAGITTTQTGAWHSVEDTYPSTLANVYFQDTAWKAAYLRTASGSLPYASMPTGSGVNVWMSDYGILPGHMFMFAQMEGKIWPYPKSVPPATAVPTNPTQFVVTK